MSFLLEEVDHLLNSGFCLSFQDNIVGFTQDVNSHVGMLVMELKWCQRPLPLERKW